ncbi:MAG TPA: histone-like nucleoid-structuring protein Lsr2 [Nocardioidaceae bacterium]|nr:histone-like nucleoid-structuring protein Lsr2 [Nocardioidaceae bacterium]
MPDDFLIARNPDPDSSLPYLLRLPLGNDGVVLKARDTWPRTSKVYCHAADGWPGDAEIIERVAVRSCVRRGAAIDLVLDRGRENRSQIVFTRIRGGRQAIFWQSARTAKQARPNVSLPTARAAGMPEFEILVDSHERYAWSFTQQQATTIRRALEAGDYGVEVAGTLVAAVERKSMQDLVATLTSGKMRYLLADLSALERAAVVVEARYSEVFKVTRVRPSVVADAVAECQVRFPQVPIMFCESRALAQEWTYRFLATAVAEAREDAPAGAVVADLPVAGAVPAAEPTTARVRAWAREHGYDVPDRGRLRPEIWGAFRAADTT